MLTINKQPHPRVDKTTPKSRQSAGERWRPEGRPETMRKTLSSLLSESRGSRKPRRIFSLGRFLRRGPSHRWLIQRRSVSNSPPGSETSLECRSSRNLVYIYRERGAGRVHREDRGSPRASFLRGRRRRVCSCLEPAIDFN